MLDERAYYRPDHGINWLRAGLFLIPVCVAVATGLLLAFLFHVGWYLIMIAALVAGGLVAGSMWIVVRLTHCRITWLATCVGIACGLLTYFSYFYFDMVAQGGPVAAAHPEFVPQYIALRMASDVVNDVGGGPNGQAKDPAVFMNWFTFGYELLIIVGLAMETGRRAAWRAYDSEHQRWMQREDIRLAIGARTALAAALDDGQLDAFLQEWRPVTDIHNTSVCTLSLEYTGHETQSPLERPVYLSAVETSLRTGVRSLFGRAGLFLQVELAAAEALRLQPLFPQFASACQDFHAELTSVQSVVPARTDTVVAGTATIEEIPESQQVQIFRGRHLLMENVCGGIPLLLLAAAAGLGYLATFPANLMIGVTVGIVAGCAGLLGIAIALCCPHAAELTYAARVLKRHFEEREGMQVDLNGPNTFHVAMTVRENWQRMKIETATDAGFATIDEAAEEVRMECDAQRYHIPFSSVISATSERFLMPIDQNTEYWYTNLTVNTKNGPQEILFCDASPVWGRWTNKKRQQRAEEISTQLSPDSRQAIG